MSFCLTCFGVRFYIDLPVLKILRKSSQVLGPPVDINYIEPQTCIISILCAPVQRKFVRSTLSKMHVMAQLALYPNEVIIHSEQDACTWQCLSQTCIHIKPPATTIFCLLFTAAQTSHECRRSLRHSVSHFYTREIAHTDCNRHYSTGISLMHFEVGWPVAHSDYWHFHP